MYVFFLQIVPMNRTNFPKRCSPEEIEVNRSNLKAYVVLPVPPYAAEGQFETIGRTTFKKFVIKAYENLVGQSGFPIHDFLNVPFIVSKTTKKPHIVKISTDTINLSTQIKPQAHVTPKTKNQIRTLTQIQPKKQFPVQLKTPNALKTSTQIRASPQIQTLPQPQSLEMNQSDDFSMDDGNFYAPTHSRYEKLLNYGTGPKSFCFV